MKVHIGPEKHVLCRPHTGYSRKVELRLPWVFSNKKTTCYTQVVRKVQSEAETSSSIYLSVAAT